MKKRLPPRKSNGQFRRRKRRGAILPKMLVVLAMFAAPFPFIGCENSQDVTRLDAVPVDESPERKAAIAYIEACKAEFGPNWETWPLRHKERAKKLISGY